MTAEIELLPLPEGYDKYSPPRLYDGQMFHEGQMRPTTPTPPSWPTAPAANLPRKAMRNPPVPRCDAGDAATPPMFHSATPAPRWRRRTTMTDCYRKKSVEVRAWEIGFDGQEPDWVSEAFDGGRIDWCAALVATADEESRRERAETAPAGDGAQKGVVAWARPVYARPVHAPEPAEEWGELVDVEFHNRPEKPEGDGWYPLVVANTGDGTPPPRINVKCETVDNGIAGSAFLKVIRVEQEDDGSLTVVIDHLAAQMNIPFEKT